MRKVFLAVEGEDLKTFVINFETPNQILEHYHINPETKNVYINGVLLSKQKMNKPIGLSGNIFMAVKNKTITRK